MELYRKKLSVIHNLAEYTLILTCHSKKSPQPVRGERGSDRLAAAFILQPDQVS